LETPDFIGDFSTFVFISNFRFLSLYSDHAPECHRKMRLGLEWRLERDWQGFRGLIGNL
jgi:hypothetical protein